jgi:hypothetical protein
MGANKHAMCISFCFPYKEPTYVHFILELTPQYPREQCIFEILNAGTLHVSERKLVWMYAVTLRAYACLQVNISAWTHIFALKNERHLRLRSAVLLLELILQCGPCWGIQSNGVQPPPPPPHLQGEVKATLWDP